MGVRLEREELRAQRRDLRGREARGEEAVEAPRRRRGGRGGGPRWRWREAGGAVIASSGGGEGSGLCGYRRCGESGFRGELGGGERVGERAVDVERAGWGVVDGGFAVRFRGGRWGRGRGDAEEGGDGGGGGEDGAGGDEAEAGGGEGGGEMGSDELVEVEGRCCGGGGDEEGEVREGGGEADYEVDGG